MQTRIGHFIQFHVTCPLASRHAGHKHITHHHHCSWRAPSPPRVGLRKKTNAVVWDGMAWSAGQEQVTRTIMTDCHRVAVSGIRSGTAATTGPVRASRVGGWCRATATFSSLSARVEDRSKMCSKFSWRWMTTCCDAGGTCSVLCVAQSPLLHDWRQ